MNDPTQTTDVSAAAPSDGNRSVSAMVIGGIIAVAVLALWALSILRLHFGVDFTDEAAYVAMPYGIALGAKPLVGEQHVLVLASLLTAPLVRAWVGLFGNSGLVLAMRYGFEVMVAGVCAVSAWALWDTTRSPWVSLAALLPIAAVPFSIFSLSYNTMSQSLLTVGLMASVVSVRRDATVRWPWLAVAGGAMSLAVVAYFPLLLVGLIQMVVLAWYLPRGSRWKGTGVYVIAAFAAAAVVLAQALPLTVQQVTQFITFNRVLYAGGAVGGGTSKLLGLVTSGATYILGHGWAVLVLALAVGLARLVDRRWRYLMALLPLVLWLGVPVGSGRGALLTIWFVGSLAPLALLFEERPAATSRLLLTVWAPSVLAGLLTGYTSSNGLPNAGIGMMPAAIVSLALMIALLVPQPGEHLYAARLAAGAVLFLGLLALLVNQQYRFVYRDASVAKLTAQVPSGPFKGLFTTPDRADEIRSLEIDLAGSLGSRGHLLSYYDFPAGYLFAHTPAAAPTVWVVENSSPAFYKYVAAYYDEKDVVEPTVILVTNPAPGDPALPIEKRLGIVPPVAPSIQRPHYSILLRTSTR